MQFLSVVASLDLDGKMLTYLGLATWPQHWPLGAQAARYRLKCSLFYKVTNRRTQQLGSVQLYVTINGHYCQIRSPKWMLSQSRNFIYFFYQFFLPLPGQENARVSMFISTWSLPTVHGGPPSTEGGWVAANRRMAALPTWWPSMAMVFKVWC